MIDGNGNGCENANEECRKFFLSVISIMKWR